MRRCVLVCAICLSLAAQENPLDSAVTFNPGGKFTGSTLPLDRTQVLRIKVDAQALLAAYVTAPPDLKNECGRLRIAIDALLKTQRFALQHDLGMSRLSARRAAGASREEQLAMREELSPIARERNLAFDTFRAQLKEMSLLDPALRDQLVARLLNRSDQPYADMAEVLSPFLKELERRLEKPISTEAVLLTADWTGSDGRSRGINLEGFDNIPVAGAKPFGRLELGKDERFQAEWKAASDIGPWLEAKLQTEGTEIRKLESELRQAMTEAYEQLSREVESLMDSWPKEPNQQALLDRFLALEARVEALKASCSTSTGGTSLGLQELGACLANLVMDGQALAVDSKTWLKDLQESISGIPKQLRTKLEGPLTRVKAAVENASATLKESYSKSLDDLRRLVVEADKLWKDVDVSSRKARRLLDEGGRPASLDTQLDLRTVPGARPETGDLVQVKAVVTKDGQGGRETVAIRVQSFQVEQFGMYFDTLHAALLAVRPTQKSETTTTQLLPGLIVNCRAGIRGWDWFNHTLAPGLGLSLSLLNFDPKKDTELGMAVNLSLFRNFLHVGYGQNLMTQDKYTYVGLNPLVLGRLAGFTR